LTITGCSDNKSSSQNILGKWQRDSGSFAEKIEFLEDGKVIFGERIASNYEWLDKDRISIAVPSIDSSSAGRRGVFTIEFESRDTMTMSIGGGDSVTKTTYKRRN